jgi:DNA-binding response OmpR family regulator
MGNDGDKAQAGGLRIQLLGEFRVRTGERPVEDAEWRLRKARSLVKILALAPGHRLHREQVMDLLWPDLEPEAASNNLRKALGEEAFSAGVAEGSSMAPRRGHAPGNEELERAIREVLRDA